MSDNKDPYVDACMRSIDDAVYATFSTQQLTAITKAISLKNIKNKTSRPHAFDLRFTVPYLFGGFYFVFLGGKDQRTYRRREEARKAKAVKLSIIILGLFIISGLVWLPLSFYGLYVLKSAYGVDIFPDRPLSDFLPDFLSFFSLEGQGS